MAYSVYYSPMTDTIKTTVTNAPETGDTAVKLTSDKFWQLITVRWEYDTARYVVATDKIFPSKGEIRTLVQTWPRDESFDIVDVQHLS